MTRDTEKTLPNLDKLDALIEPILRAARIPGAAVAIVSQGRTVFAKGYGYRDLATQAPMTAQTAFPIASTTKAINATLLGMLVDEGKIAWDAPVQNYLPRFRLGDPLVSSQVTIRDLIVMRTGLPRHDWMWLGNHSVGRAELIDRLRHLELSAGFRQRYQYNNLTVTAAGHVAEAVTGQSWEDLVRQKIVEPLGMSSTVFDRPATGNVTSSYHETARREVLLSHRLTGAVTAPSGGLIYSTVEDMTRWLIFNLNGGKAGDRALIQAQTLKEIHTPQMNVEPTTVVAPTPGAPYAMGWFVDTYHGRARVSHNGYHHDVNSEVMLFPGENLGIVSFINSGPIRFARFIGQRVFETIEGLKPWDTLEEKLAQYEQDIETLRQRIAAKSRVANTSPSHALEDYTGRYSHPGYGSLEIRSQGETLSMAFNAVHVPMEHWHYDVWTFAENDIWSINREHEFDRLKRLLFETDADGRIAAIQVPLEPTVAPIRFVKQ